MLLFVHSADPVDFGGSVSELPGSALVCVVVLEFD